MVAIIFSPTVMLMYRHVKNNFTMQILKGENKKKYSSFIETKFMIERVKVMDKTTNLYLRYILVPVPSYLVPYLHQFSVVDYM